MYDGIIKASHLNGVRAEGQTKMTKITIKEDAQIIEGLGFAMMLAVAVTKSFQRTMTGYEDHAVIDFNYYHSDKKMLLIEMPASVPVPSFDCLYEMFNSKDDGCEWERVGESTIAVFPSELSKRISYAVTKTDGESVEVIDSGTGHYNGTSRSIAKGILSRDLYQKWNAERPIEVVTF